MSILLKLQQVNIERKNADTAYYKNGVLVYELSTINITGSIQPITGKSTQYLSGFSQELDSKKVWTKSELEYDDILVYNGKRYRCFKIQNYEGLNCLKLNHNEGFFIEIPNDAAE